MALSEIKNGVTVQGQMLLGVTGTSFNMISNSQRCNLGGLYLLKVNNRNTKTRCGICSKLTIKIPLNN